MSVGAKLLWRHFVVLILCSISAQAVEIDYGYQDFDEPSGYAVFFTEAKVQKGDVVTITGEHKEEMNDSDVRYIPFYESIVEVIPTEIFVTFPNVKNLHLANSRLVEIEQRSLKGAVNLEILNVKLNDITQIAAETFIEVPKLKKLYLNNNEIKVVHEHAFKNLTKLEILTLNVNHIKYLHKDIFEDLVSLKMFYIYANRIQELPEGLFRNNLMLEEIELYKNQIHTIFPGLFSHLKSSTNVDLRYNSCVNFRTDWSMTHFSKLNDAIKKCLKANTVQTMAEFCKEY